VTTLFDPPPVYDLPLSKGGDLRVDFIYQPLVVDEDGAPVLLDGELQYETTDYPVGASLRLVIDSTPPIEADAVITGSVASVRVDKAETDPVPGRVFWRAVLTFGDGTDVVARNGRTVRKDGK
jgi:hypothetical protein